MGNVKKHVLYAKEKQGNNAWNRNVDQALLTGASEMEVMTAKQSDT